jgi:hypothetical protein
MDGKTIFFIIVGAVVLAWLVWVAVSVYKDIRQHGLDWSIFREPDKK